MRKRGAVVMFLLFLSMVFGFSSLGFPGSVDLANKGSGSTGASSKEKPIGKIEWLVFSATKYQHERELVMKHEYITRSQARAGGAIYIALADLNDDGIPEIFTYIDLSEFCGTLGCPMNIYRREGQGLVSLFPDGPAFVGGFNMFIDIDRNGRQKVLGILSSKTMGWHDIALRKTTVWRWNGKSY